MKNTNVIFWILMLLGYQAGAVEWVQCTYWIEARGTVSHAKDLSPISGARVSIKALNANRAANTNSKGNYGERFAVIVNKFYHPKWSNNQPCRANVSVEVCASPVGYEKGCRSQNILFTQSAYKQVNIPRLSLFLEGECLKDDALFNSQNGGCKDLNSGYTWSQISDKKLKYDQAISYCDQLDFIENGVSVWRLPEVSELATLAKVVKAHLNLNYNDWYRATNSKIVRLIDGKVLDRSDNNVYQTICIHK